HAELGPPRRVGAHRRWAHVPGHGDRTLVRERHAGDDVPRPRCRLDPLRRRTAAHRRPAPGAQGDAHVGPAPGPAPGLRNRLRAGRGRRIRGSPTGYPRRRSQQRPGEVTSRARCRPRSSVTGPREQAEQRTTEAPVVTTGNGQRLPTRPPARSSPGAHLDDQVVEAAKRGDRHAWEAAYVAYGKGL